MAGGQGPRQKMINLMYLVFIAMLALNMSKEVLTAFGLMEESVADNNETLEVRNEASFEALAAKAKEQPKQYQEAAESAAKVTQISEDFDNYLSELKAEMMASIDPENQGDYQSQDKTDFLDTKFFQGDGLSEDGKVFIQQMNDYRTGMIAALPDAGYDALKEEINNKFDTSDVLSERSNPDSEKINYLNYHFEGYPLIASKAKITQMQNDIKNAEADVLGQLLQGELIEIASMNNYRSIVSLEKGAFFNGETVTGEVVLGRYDDNMKPTKVIINGSEVPASQIQNGRVMLNFGAGAVGDKEITGEMQFVENGETVTIPINQKYSVIGKPNSATISADKMNVVYRGVDNPMTISFAGVDPSKVSASAPGLSSRGGSSYLMKPAGGASVNINVSAKLPDGSTATDSKSFRIKDLPNPTGLISGEFDGVRKNRANLAISTVSAAFLDFDFDLTPQVTEFIFKVQGQPGIKVSGNKLNDAAKAALQRAPQGSIVQIAQIKTTVPGVRTKATTPVSVELTD
ncbi:type IX secretion system motor protein PorM/GldM [Nonlabens agnitus]|uniref:Gliding motility protein GldM n=1 Tax=Nonlabens agnitus TaxID=870484 RepID=A0A2S9WXN1_9FLAO|nr:gliding motility protein GldM [Nonlabens agnitus]PRP68211.1 gliding motility protein GldM [Nonlabens agnitus]